VGYARCRVWCGLCEEECCARFAPLGDSNGGNDLGYRLTATRITMTVPDRFSFLRWEDAVKKFKSVDQTVWIASYC
jgi:hypothetical protein